MYRTVALALFLAFCCAAQDDKTRSPAKTQPPKTQPQEPPEEDESLTPREYTFNPLEANKDVTIGNYYFKRKNYRAAAKRFTEATLWNPGFAEAYLRLAETEEKLHDQKAARQAYAKYVELAPDARNIEAIRKKAAER